MWGEIYPMIQWIGWNNCVCVCRTKLEAAKELQKFRKRPGGVRCVYVYKCHVTVMWSVQCCGAGVWQEIFWRGENDSTLIKLILTFLFHSLFVASTQSDPFKLKTGGGLVNLKEMQEIESEKYVNLIFPCVVVCPHTHTPHTHTHAHSTHRHTLHTHAHSTHTHTLHTHTAPNSCITVTL